MSDANEGTPTLREVLETAECHVLLEVLDPFGEPRRCDKTHMRALNGPLLVEKLERSRVLAGNALLGCRPKLRVDTDKEGHAALILAVSPFDDAVLQGRT